MQYAEIGSSVAFKQQKAKVIGENRINERIFTILELEDGQQVSVPLLDIMWNGNSFFVRPDGVRMAEGIRDAEKVLQGIRDGIKIWDAENPKPTGFMREDALDAYFMEWLRNGSATYNDKDLGLIVRYIIDRLEDL